MILEKRDNGGWHILDDTSNAMIIFGEYPGVSVRIGTQDKITQQLTLKPTNAYIDWGIGRWGCLESWDDKAKIVWEGGEDGA